MKKAVVRRIFTKLWSSSPSYFLIHRFHSWWPKICKKLLSKLKISVWKTDRVIISTTSSEMKISKICEENLTTLSKGKAFFFHRIVIWVQQCFPLKKQESMQLVHRSSPPLKKAQTRSSARKVMATVFWDLKVILLIV